MRTKQPPDPDKLQREKAGAYRTGDGRFVVSSDGGEWFVTDTERVDGFGLELVLGPLGTLSEAKAALTAQRADPQGHTIEERKELAKKAATEAARTGARTRDKRASAGPAGKGSEPAVRKAPEPPPPKGPRPAQRVRPARWRKRGDQRDDVAAALRRINDAWTRGQPDRATSDLHPEVVFVPAGFAGQVEGPEAVVDSYREFMTDATVHDYGESDLDVRVWGEAAVATYRWEMDWEMDGERHAESGRDVFVFGRVAGRWLAAWRLVEMETSGSEA